MLFLFGPNILILLPAIILAAYAQWKVRSTYAQYTRVEAQSRMTAQQVAEQILASELIQDVSFELSQRALSDHYDPRKKILRLSAPNSSSIAAIGVAAHEAGHAIQHARNYAPLSFRTTIVPIATFGSQLAFPLFFIGLFAQMPGLVTAGLVAFSAAVFFTLLTLPVEFNASRRAIASLRGTGIVNDEELGSVKEVLFAAALTYVAAAAMAALQLLMLLSMRRRR
ncbi:zinc metallopeptidase [Candidatus Bipolaricaulota bacterium]